MLHCDRAPRLRVIDTLRFYKGNVNFTASALQKKRGRTNTEVRQPGAATSLGEFRFQTFRLPWQVRVRFVLPPEFSIFP